MEKRFEAKTRIIVQQPTKNILLKLWRQLTMESDAVYSPSLEEAHLPSNILNRLWNTSLVLGFPLPRELNRLLSPDCTTEEKLLPKSKGGWHILTFLGKSPKGAIALAKILTRREGDYIHEVFYLQTPDNSCCTSPRIAGRTHFCPCCPYSSYWSESPQNY